MNRVVINARTGATGDYSDWVGAFAELWSGGRKNLDRFLDVMSPGIRLVAPGFKPTEGWDEGYKAFGRAFEAMPDLTGEVRRWSASGDLLFVEMTFSATVGGRKVEWDNVDRFLFRDGYAVERVAYFDPTAVRKAFLSSLSGLKRLARLRWRT